ncbi:uncharacterized protein LOC128954802 [Oppia nitens]|uniref:uncharacterized protein LOC128954802 n=1 Tax=Oppia nitens TaxID=1686743 RepID=UPI0023DB4AD2|nr:uncharacterized protein LOC128954802 [Oppia nitens]
MKTIRQTICLHNLLLSLISIAIKTTGVVGGGGDDSDCLAERKVANKCLDNKWLGVSTRTEMTDVTCCRAIESTCIDYKFQMKCYKTTIYPIANQYQNTYEVCRDANINPTAELCRKLRPTADNCKKYLPCLPEDKILIAEGGEADDSGSGDGGGGGGGGGNGSQTPAGTQTQDSQKPNGAATRLPKLVPQSVSTLLLSVLLAGAVVFKWFCDDN